MAKGPGKINIVSILVVIGVLAAIWAGVRFAPSMLTARNVEKVLRQGATDVYAIRRQQSKDFSKITAKVKGELEGLGVKGAKVDVVESPEWITVRATYEVALTMPAAVQQKVVEGKVSAKVGSY